MLMSPLKRNAALLPLATKPFARNCPAVAGADHRAGVTGGFFQGAIKQETADKKSRRPRLLTGGVESLDNEQITAHHFKLKLGNFSAIYH